MVVTALHEGLSKSFNMDSVFIQLVKSDSVKGFQFGHHRPAIMVHHASELSNLVDRMQSG